MLPLAIHGDGFPCAGVGKAWSSVMDAWQWGSLLVTAKSKFCIFLIFLVHHALRGTKTLDDAFEKMVYSFNAIYEGRWPSLTWDGEPIRDPKETPTPVIRLLSFV